MIYIVEDDYDMGGIESYALKNSGFEVSVFDNSHDLLFAIKQKAPCLIILNKDIVLSRDKIMENVWGFDF